MKIIYTYHAEEQMQERGILKVWVEEAIKCPHLTKREDEKYIVSRKLNGRILKVVFIKEKHIKVITTYFRQ